MINCAETSCQINLEKGVSFLSAEKIEKFNQLLNGSQLFVSRVMCDHANGNTLLFLRSDNNIDPDGKKICNRVTLPGFQLGYENNQGVFVKDLGEIKEIIYYKME